MNKAHNLSDFHFDTKESGERLKIFLDDAHISLRAAERLTGYSYDTIVDTLHGHNKDSKMEFVVKICAISGRSIQEWCEYMLVGASDEVANKIRRVFSVDAFEHIIGEKEQLEKTVTRWLDMQTRSIDQYQIIREEMRQQYEDEIKHLREENKRLLDALLAAPR